MTLQPDEIMKMVKLRQEQFIHLLNMFLKLTDPNTPEARSHVAKIVDYKLALEALLKKYENTLDEIIGG